MLEGYAMEPILCGVTATRITRFVWRKKSDARICGLNLQRDMDLIEQLRAAGKGTEEWRVADPTDGSYCIAFSRADSINPEREAREWLANHRKRFPDSQKANYEARRAMAQTNADLMMLQAADEIERLRAALANLKEAVEYTPLGERGIKAVEQARNALVPPNTEVSGPPKAGRA